MNFVIALAFLLISASPAWANCPDLKRTFSPAVLADLKAARDLPATKPFQGKSEYVVEVVYSNDFKKYVVFLGEMHVKTLDARKTGLRVIRHFDLRAFERLPPAERRSLTWGTHWTMATGEVLAGWAGRDEGSTISDVVNTGTTLTTQGYVLRNGKLDHACRYRDLCAFENDERKSRYTNIALERGNFIDPAPYDEKIAFVFRNVSDEYVLKLRNKRMLDSIQSILLSFDQNVLLVVTGSAHTPDLKDALIHDLGFDACVL